MESGFKPTLKTLPNLIKMAWKLRLERDALKFESLVHSLEDFQKKIHVDLSLDTKGQILSLRASLARLQRKLKLSESLCRQCEDIYITAGKEKPYEFYFQN
jgi:hypothetical protein